METHDILITIFLTSILILAGLFVGDMMGQMARGTYRYISDIEMYIILAATMLCLELVIITIFRERKPKNTENIKELIKEVRKITY